MKTSKEIIKQAERDLREQFEKIDDIRDYNQEKVLNAFVENRVAPEHFYTVAFLILFLVMGMMIWVEKF